MDINRKAAFEALLDIETKGAYSNIAVNKNIEKYRPEDEAFVRNLVYGVLENQIYLDHRIAQLMKQKLKKVRSQALILIRMGAYQIEFMESVPAYAAINESVNLAKKTCRGLEGFVNGVLRSYDRQKFDLSIPNREEDPVGYLSVKFSYNREIAGMWYDEYGLDYTEALMSASNKTPPLTIRVNTLRITPRELRSQLEARGFEVKNIETGNQAYDDLLEDIAFEVRGSGLIADSAYKEGLFSVQDISSMLSILTLSPCEGETVIDVCAAPGGKSLCAAELMHDKGKIISCDVHEHKIKLISKSAERLGISIISAQQNDGLQLREDFMGMADKVIVDAPCSGLGVVRRKPEIKLHTSIADLDNLAQIQIKILENAAKYVNKSGALIYSTCTISKRENEDIIKLFLQKNNIFFQVSETQLFPNIDNADGFYFSVLQRFL